MGSRPSCAAVIIAPRKVIGTHSTSLGLALRVEVAMRVKRSGVITEGSALAISPCMLWISSCIVPRWVLGLATWFFFSMACLIMSVIVLSSIT